MVPLEFLEQRKQNNAPSVLVYSTGGKGRQYYITVPPLFQSISVAGNSFDGIISRDIII